MHALQRFCVTRAAVRTSARQSALSLRSPASFPRAASNSISGAFAGLSYSPPRAHFGSTPTSPTLPLRSVPAGSSGLQVNAGVLSHLQLMSQYHLWANTRLFVSHVSKLSDAEYFGAAGDSLFFRSVHGTLVHIAVADKLWLTRLTSGGQSGAEHLWADSATAADTEKFIPDRAEITAALLQGSKDLQAYVATLTDANAVESFAYRNTSNKEMSAVRSIILTHVFNHGTHHRGQISAALRQLGHRAPELDLLYMMNPAA